MHPEILRRKELLSAYGEKKKEWYVVKRYYESIRRTEQVHCKTARQISHQFTGYIG